VPQCPIAGDATGGEGREDRERGGRETEGRGGRERSGRNLRLYL